MADPLSLTASIIAVLDLSAKVLKYAKAVKDGSSERSRLLKDVINIQGSLQSLQSHVEMTPPEDPWIRAVKDLNRPGGPLDVYKVSLDCLLKKLDPGSPSKNGLKTVTRSMVWLFQMGEIGTILSTIERQQQLFNIAISMDSMALNRAIFADVQDSTRLHRAMTSDLKQARTDIQAILDRNRTDLEANVLRWLATMAPQKAHFDISSRRADGTGVWVSKTRIFQHWAQPTSTDNILWCSGIPGSGKTFIASSVIDHPRSTKNEQQASLAYAYCDYKLFQNDSAKSLLGITCSLLNQFMANEERLPSILIKAYNLRGNANETSPSTKLEEGLIEYCTGRKTYIVVDALDETGQSGNRRPLLTILKALEVTGAKMFYTTRPDQKHLEQHLKGHPHIEIEAAETDIRRFLDLRIDKRMEEEDELEDLLSHDLREEIITTLCQRAHGI